MFGITLVVIQQVVSWMAVVSSFTVYAAGSKTCFDIIKRKTTGDTALFPFVASLYSAVVGLKYGLLINVQQLILVNVVSTTCQISYLIIYYVYTREKRKCHRVLGVALPLLYGILFYAKYIAVSDIDVIPKFGILVIVLNLIMTASPLVSLVDVVQLKSTKTLAFGFILTNCIACFLWMLFGFILADKYVTIPNLLGLVLTLFQLSLFIIYPTNTITTTTTESNEKLIPTEEKVESIDTIP